VAHNFKLKGVPRLIEALGRLVVPGGTSDSEGRKQLYAVIVGRDDLTPYVRLADQLGIRNRVIFAGSTQRISAFFHAADFLVHPTYYDPCSRVVLEAMAAGLPAITTRFNGAAERIASGQTGYVIEGPDDTTALAAAMADLCDAGRRETMGPLALAAVSGLTMAHHAERVLALYDELLRRRAEGESDSR
jgi:UDP-glucose:(heptosyl)LPS alpha-1,3-glucosyltransferase